jgi:hypothetical protein
LAGIKIVDSMVLRAGDGPCADEEKQLILESLLPFKHEILGLLSIGLSDSEPQVAAASDKVINIVGWWP